MGEPTSRESRPAASGRAPEDAVGARLRTLGPQSMLVGVQVVQGIALSLLVLHLLDLSRSAGGLAWGDWLFADVAFMCIASTFYFHLLLAAVLPVPPSINQIMIPLTIGACAIALARTFDQPATFFWLYLAYVAISIVGFAYTAWHNARGTVAGLDTTMREALATECRKNIACLALIGIVTLILAIGYPTGARSGPRDLAFVAINAGVFVYMMWRTETRFARQVRALAAAVPAEPGRH